MSWWFRRALMLAVVLGMASGTLAAKPNFSGNWKLNNAKSDFGEFPPPASMSQKVNHEEPSLKVATQMSTGNGDWDFDASYRTDGKETVNQFGPSSMKTICKWEGDTLVMESKGDFGDGELTIVDRWELSEDGKTLTMKRRFTSSRGELNQRLVMEKE